MTNMSLEHRIAKKYGVLIACWEDYHEGNGGPVMELMRQARFSHATELGLLGGKHCLVYSNKLLSRQKTEQIKNDIGAYEDEW